jgi:hypothetical protein
MGIACFQILYLSSIGSFDKSVNLVKVFCVLEGFLDKARTMLQKVGLARREEAEDSVLGAISS